MCKFCDTDRAIYCKDEGNYLTYVRAEVFAGLLNIQFRADDGTYDTEVDVPINFCPMCGRQLRSDENKTMGPSDDEPNNFKW